MGVGVGVAGGEGGGEGRVFKVWVRGKLHTARGGSGFGEVGVGFGFVWGIWGGVLVRVRVAEQPQIHTT